MPFDKYDKYDEGEFGNQAEEEEFLGVDNNAEDEKKETSSIAIAVDFLGLLGFLYRADFKRLTNNFEKLFNPSNIKLDNYYFTPFLLQQDSKFRKDGNREAVLLVDEAFCTNFLDNENIRNKIIFSVGFLHGLALKAGIHPFSLRTAWCKTNEIVVVTSIDVAENQCEPDQSCNDCCINSPENKKIYDKGCSRALSVNLSKEENDFFETLNEYAEIEEFETKTGDGVVMTNNVSLVFRCAGGWIRDKLLGKDSNDIDIAIDQAMGKPFVKHFQQKHSKIRTTVIAANDAKSKQLETCTIFFPYPYPYDDPKKDPEPVEKYLEIDFVNLRKEKYQGDSRIPKQEFGTPVEDASRRDLTINTLFYNINEAYVEDFTGLGLVDLLVNRVIRTPLEPTVTFNDDPLRMLRAVRFAARFSASGFELADEIVKACKDNKSVREQFSNPDKISRERIGQELSSMLGGPDPVKAILLLHKTKLVDLIFVDFKSTTKISFQMRRIDQDDDVFERKISKASTHFSQSNELYHEGGLFNFGPLNAYSAELNTNLKTTYGYGETELPGWSLEQKEKILIKNGVNLASLLKEQKEMSQSDLSEDKALVPMPMQIYFLCALILSSFEPVPYRIETRTVKDEKILIEPTCTVSETTTYVKETIKWNGDVSKFISSVLHHSKKFLEIEHERRNSGLQNETKIAKFIHDVGRHWKVSAALSALLDDENYESIFSEIEESSISQAWTWKLDPLLSRNELKDILLSFSSEKYPQQNIFQKKVSELMTHSINHRLENPDIRKEELEQYLKENINTIMPEITVISGGGLRDDDAVRTWLLDLIEKPSVANINDWNDLSSIPSFSRIEYANMEINLAQDNGDVHLMYCRAANDPAVKGKRDYILIFLHVPTHQYFYFTGASILRHTEEPFAYIETSYNILGDSDVDTFVDLVRADMARNGRIMSMIDDELELGKEPTTTISFIESDDEFADEFAVPDDYSPREEEEAEEFIDEFAVGTQRPADSMSTTPAGTENQTTKEDISMMVLDAFYAGLISDQMLPRLLRSVLRNPDPKTLAKTISILYKIEKTLSKDEFQGIRDGIVAAAV